METRIICNFCNQDLYDCGCASKFHKELAQLRKQVKELEGGNEAAHGQIRLILDSIEDAQKFVDLQDRQRKIEEAARAAREYMEGEIADLKKQIDEPVKILTATFKGYTKLGTADALEEGKEGNDAGQE